MRKHGSRNKVHDKRQAKMHLHMGLQPGRSGVVGNAERKRQNARRSFSSCVLDGRNIKIRGIATLLEAMREVSRPGGMHRIRLAMNNYRRLTDKGAK